MLLGLNIYRECVSVDVDFVHYTVYTLSATVGVVITIMAFYNIYSVNYRIRKSLLFSFSPSLIYADVDNIRQSRH